MSWTELCFLCLFYRCDKSWNLGEEKKTCKQMIYSRDFAHLCCFKEKRHFGCFFYCNIETTFGAALLRSSLHEYFFHRTFLFQFRLLQLDTDRHNLNSRKCFCIKMLCNENKSRKMKSIDLHQQVVCIQCHFHGKLELDTIKGRHSVNVWLHIVNRTNTVIG